jgi:hypothetical protein
VSQSVDSECGFRVWIHSVDSESGFRVWIKSEETEQFVMRFRFERNDIDILLMGHGEPDLMTLEL